MPRLFVGLDVPEHVEKALMRLEYGLEDMNWVDPKNFHLTLRFIGEVAEDQMDRVRFVLDQIDFVPFSMHINGMGCFKKRGGKCTGLWASVDPGEELLALAEKVNTPFEGPLNVKKFFKAFTPHITLARPKNKKVKDVQSFLDHNRIFQIRDIPVTEFYLYESHGAEDENSDYEILDTYTASSQ